jgi:peroxiredoxin
MKGTTVRILCITLLSLAVVLVAGCGAKAKPAARAASGVSPVTTVLKANQLDGKVVLVEFGTIGCQLSEKGLKAMADMKARNAIPGLNYLRLEPAASKAQFDAYYSTQSLGFPVVRDTDMAIANALATTVFPRFALLDKFGRIRYRGSQPAEKDLADWTPKLMAETQDAGPNAPLLGETALDMPSLLCGTRVPDLAGKTKSLAEYSGKLGVLLAFVDTKCPFSAGASKEMPVVAAALKQYGVGTVLVNIGDPESDVRKAYGSGFPDVAVVYDAGKAVQQNWKVEFVPTVALLDTAGQVIYRGSPVWADVATALAKKLSLAPDAVKLDAQGTKQG